MKYPLTLTFLEVLTFGIKIDSGYPWKIHIGIDIDIDLLKFTRLTLALTILSFMYWKSKPMKTPILVNIYKTDYVKLK